MAIFCLTNFTMIIIEFSRFMKYICLLISILLFIPALTVFSSTQSGDTPSEVYRFVKTELNSGLQFNRKNLRESSLTESGSYFENRENYATELFYSLNSWRFDDLKQETGRVILGIGPQWATGQSELNHPTLIKTADNSMFGAVVSGEINYSGRYYYGDNQYAVVVVDGTGSFESLKINSKGFSSNPMSSAFATPFEEEYTDNRFRYTLHAKAGWGLGWMEIVNHRMVAEYLLKDFYKDKLFTPEEKVAMTEKVAQIKNFRKLRTPSSLKKEAEELGEFLNNRFLLTIPENLEMFWKYSEFAPRFDGNRLEAGPFFSYFNREPDFVYGGFLKFDSGKYHSLKWSRHFKSELTYNRYKTRDWIKLETSLIFDYYCQLRTKFSFGLKYTPIVETSNDYDRTPFQNVFTPLVGFFTQLSRSLRMEGAFMYNITNKNNYFIKGPEFSLSVFRSRY
jgi:hypothetical protein